MSGMAPIGGATAGFGTMGASTQPSSSGTASSGLYSNSLNTNTYNIYNNYNMNQAAGGQGSLGSAQGIAPKQQQNAVGSLGGVWGAK
jgi:hypothetical protein